MALLISILVIFYSFFVSTNFISNSLDNEHFRLIFISSFYPISLLLVQWPLRKIFINIYQIEPEHKGRTFNLFDNLEDNKHVFYTAILQILPFIILMLIGFILGIFE